MEPAPTPRGSAPVVAAVIAVDRGAVRRDDLWLIEENLTAFRVDQYFQPADVVVAVRLVVAERFDARKVLEPASL